MKINFDRIGTGSILSSGFSTGTIKRRNFPEPERLRFMRGFAGSTEHNDYVLGLKTWLLSIR
uniref:Uncharacterized protein n=1 Tax=Meloidogyne enterolobii TaxID=390850 RepID=A0A6V7VAE3_MELEN|nr:unnamed protein product [Meloidogyne enterolobii]